MSGVRKTPEQKLETLQTRYERNCEIINVMFPKIYALVEEGLTIRQALKKLSICSRMYYQFASEETKQYLKMIKVSNASRDNNALYGKIYRNYKNK